MGAESEELRPTLVMIVDDQRYARLGLALMIRKAPDLHVVAEAGDGQEALEVLEELNRSTGLPDVVLMDIRMPVLNGIDATAVLTRRYPAIRTLVLTTYDQDDYAFGALGAGASGFLLKDTRSAELHQAIRAVAAATNFTPPSPCPIRPRRRVWSARRPHWRPKARAAAWRPGSARGSRGAGDR